MQADPLTRDLARVEDVMRTQWMLAVAASAALAVACSSSDESYVAPSPQPQLDSGAPPNDSAPGDTGEPEAPPAKPTRIVINSVTAAGDLTMSGNLALDGGKLAVTLSAIRDPDDPTKPIDPAKVSFAVTASGAPMTCSIAKVSDTGKGAVDLVFINDTTGSMSGTVTGIKNSVQKFAEDIAAGGVDARFSMYTYGDAFATKSASSTLTVGLGDFAPPSFDDVERPYIGLSALPAFQSFLTELGGCSCLGNGGGDGPENTLGALAYAHDKVAWRGGAARVFVAIGDNPSHQQGSGDFITAPWTPPLADTELAHIGGDAVIHVVGRDYGSAPYYNIKQMAAKTGGVFLDLPSDGNVNLSTIGLTSWITSSFAGTCNDPQIGKFLIVVTANITGAKNYVGTLTFDVELL